MNYVRLKTGLNLEHIQDRLQYHPEIIEFHLVEQDLYKPETIINRIRLVKSKGTKVYLHHPMTFQGQYLDIISSNESIRSFYDWSCKLLAQICRQEDISCIIHAHYGVTEHLDVRNKGKRKELRQRIEQILKISDTSFLWEDSNKGLFSQQNPFLLREVIQPLQLPLNLDISHSFIALKGDNIKLEALLERMHEYARYFHLVDSMGTHHDSLPLGKGKIDWGMVKPFVKDKDFIFEIDLKETNYRDCTPMLESARYFDEIHTFVM